MRYRDRLKKKVTLPSGIEVVIEKVNAIGLPAMQKRVNETDEESGRRVITHMLIHAVGLFDGLTIVETVTDERTQIGITEIEQADINFLSEAIMEFSGLTKRGEEARGTFPGAAQSQNGHHSTPIGEAVSGAPAVGLVAAAG